MANDGPEHKLVAILAVDIVGYSGLTEIDQSGTHGQLLAHRKEVIDPAIAKYGGRIFTTAGDGFLFEFASPLNAVRCVVAIQRDMERRNINVPADSRIVFRVGVSTAEQNRSKGRRKTGPFSVMRYAVLRVVPLVHRRAPRCFA